MTRTLVVLGTRPEAIKLAPVIHALKQHAGPNDETLVCSTGQHREMLLQTFQQFGITPDIDLDIMKPGQSPADVVGRLMLELGQVYRDHQPDWVVVQGDTATVVAGALSAALHRIKLAHVEAGLRTYDNAEPFPEEINRRVVGVVADQHFAATTLARENLISEGVSPASIMVTGNTVIDSLNWMVDSLEKEPASPESFTNSDERLVVVTAHRRESFGEPIRQICLAIRDIARTNDRVRIVFPVHPNPMIHEPVHEILGNEDRVELIEPQDYSHFVGLLRRAYMILSDSGGVQEEASALGIPTLLLRDCSERPEAIDSGVVLSVGTNRELITHHASKLLNDPDTYAPMAQPTTVFGDGKASVRIAKRLLNLATNGEDLDPANIHAIKSIVSS
jgi:UDP-N-acetylglucosamine 2-epimerase (non-hydrolysing)